MPLHSNDIRAAVFSDAMETYWTTCLAESLTHSDNERAALLAWVREVRQSIMQSLEDIDDDEELVTAAALSYIELKSRWQMLNTQINYQVFRTGDANPTLVYKASLLSVLVDALGKLLSPEDILKIQEFLLNPTADTPARG